MVSWVHIVYMADTDAMPPKPDPNPDPDPDPK
jgi:hypothetical protein